MPNAVTIRIAMTLIRALAAVTALASLAYAAGFIGGFWTPTRLDAQVLHPAPSSALVDLALLVAAALAYHAVGQPACRRWWRRWLPGELLGVLGTLGSSLGLGLLLWQWRPTGGVVWMVSTPALAGLLRLLYGLGWSLLLVAGRAPLRRLALTPARSTSATAERRSGWRPSPAPRGPSSWIRRPLDPGLLLVAWATPTMTAAHLVLACAVTTWLGVARSLATDRVPEEEERTPAWVVPGREDLPSTGTSRQRRERRSDGHSDGWAA